MPQESIKIRSTRENNLKDASFPSRIGLSVFECVYKIGSGCIFPLLRVVRPLTAQTRNLTIRVHFSEVLAGNYSNIWFARDGRVIIHLPPKPSESV
jgi:hypothetical protein